MRRAPDHIWEFLAPIVEGLDYLFVGASLGQGESGQTLRVYIDKEGKQAQLDAEEPQPIEELTGKDSVKAADGSGILVDDCAIVSRQLSAALDVDEDLIAGEYCLEVSSPGVDRPLFSVADFKQQVGNVVRLRLSMSATGRRNYKGKLNSVEGDTLFVEIDNEQHELPFEDVEFANLITRVR